MSNKEFSKFNYESVRRQEMSKSNSGKYSVETEKSFNEYLKGLDKTRNFNQNLFDKGAEYYNVGGTLENIPDELRNNESFIRGYNHAERLSKINEMNGGRSR